MARRKKEEKVTVAGFDWVREDPPSQPERERWRADVPAISVFVTFYGYSDLRGGHFRGWRVVSGAPGKDEHQAREVAMEAARSTIESEVRNRIVFTRKVIDDTNAAMAKCREAGIPLGSKS